MNIYKYINSREIATHLENIGYQFSALESAYVVEMCKHITAEEKNNARMELIHSTENVSVGNDNLHNFLASQAVAGASGNDTYHDAEVFFSDIVLNIPTPFKKGDIMIARDDDANDSMNIDNEKVFVLTSECPSADYPFEGVKGKSVDGLAYLSFGEIAPVWHYMLDCEYYPMGTADFNATQHRERILQIISDFVKGNTTEEQMREAYRMAALDRANAELDDFFTNFN